MSQALREEVHACNLMLLRCGLVTMHSGNASGRDPATGQIFIKPSGVDYDKLTPEMLVTISMHIGATPIWTILFSFKNNSTDSSG